MDKKIILEKCICGKNKISIETDEMSQATFIECRICHRVIGTLSKDEAIKMWNGAMKIIKGEK